MAKVAKIGCETVVGKVPRLAQDFTGISPNPEQGVFFHILRSPGPEKAALMSYFASEDDYFFGVNALGSTTVVFVGRVGKRGHKT